MVGHVDACISQYLKPVGLIYTSPFVLFAFDKVLLKYLLTEFGISTPKSHADTRCSISIKLVLTWLKASI